MLLWCCGWPETLDRHVETSAVAAVKTLQPMLMQKYLVFLTLEVYRRTGLR